MKRYIIKKNKQWAVVNANYKRQIKVFDTQKEAIIFGSKLINTTSLFIQGKDNKFRKLSNWDFRQDSNYKIAKYIPKYVYKDTNNLKYLKEHRKNMISIYLIIVIFVFMIISLIFLGLYLWEDFK